MVDRGKTGSSRQAGPTPRGRASASRRPSQGQKTTSKQSGSRAAARKAQGGSHAGSAAKQAPKKKRPSTTSVGMGGRSARSRSASSRAAASSRRSVNANASSGIVTTVKDAVTGSRTTAIVVAAVALVVLLVLGDTFANWGKAYANVSINGVSVAGMTADDIKKTLDEKYASRLSSSQVTVYASEEARQRESEKYRQEEDEALAEQISAEDAQEKVTSWTTNGLALQASLDYDQVIDEAMEAGRKGGPFGRIALAVSGTDIPLEVTFNDSALDSFASDIDKTVGDACQDATVSIEDGVARAVDGHDGNMVDRAWLAGKISDVFLEKNGATYVIAESSAAPSRTTMEQAEAMRDAVNKALSSKVSFAYKSGTWTADAVELGNWTKVDVVESNGGYDLAASVDSTAATASLVKHLSSSTTGVTSDSVLVDFENSDGGVVVKTSGAGEIPEVVPAIESLGEALYGETGIAWSAGADGQAVTIDIGESNAPETLMFEQAVDLGIITVLGEYTTEFSNEEGTENRNHNIRLVSDMLNDTVCEANGGEWSFNTHTGDTNLDPPFSSAGSIVNGEYVDSIGGGICQVATTIFNAVYEAGLDVVQRRNHSLYIESYPTGRDVGVSYPELDFVWANKLPSDVLLKISYTDTTITAKIYGVYTGYTVESTEGEWSTGAKYTTEFEVDETMAKGDSYLKTIGEDGSKISVTRTVKDKSGNTISEDLFESVYDAKNEVYLIGPGTDTAPLMRDASKESSSEGADDEDADDELEEGSGPSSGHSDSDELE